MLIEAHWKVLKRNHLDRFNRARLDLLVYVIVEKHFTELLTKFNRTIVRRLEGNSWEKTFVRKWNKLVNRRENPESSQLYQPSVER